MLDWLPALTAAIAALSAYLSLRSVRQAREIWEHSLLPVLSPWVYKDGTKLRLSVVNRSKTVAAGAGWAVLWADRRNDGHLPDRVALPDTVVGPEKPVMDFRDADRLDGPKPPLAIVWCRDRYGDLHVWDTRQEHTHLTKAQSTAITPADLLMRLASRKSVETATHCGDEGVSGYI